MAFEYNVSDLQADPKVTAEEVRRAQVAETSTKRLGFLLTDLQDLAEKDLRGRDPLAALETTGEKILSLALHTRGLLRSAEGRSDAFLEATAANVQTGLRKACKAMEDHDRDLGVWADTLELMKPIQKDVQRIAEGLERPGIKTAVTPAPGGPLFDGEGKPTPEAAAVAAPAPTPAPAAAPLQTLGYDPDKVMDAELVEQDEFETWDDEERTAAFDELLNRLETEGVEAGLKVKDWKKAQAAWQHEIDQDAKTAYRLLTFAVHYRRFVSWNIPTVEELEAYEAQQLDAAAGE